MKPFASSLVAVAGLVLAGCDTTEYSAYHDDSPGYAPASSLDGSYATPTLDDDTRARLETQSPQTYTRISQSQPLSVADVSAMQRAGVGDDTIINEIDTTHSTFHLSAADIIDLHNNGVSERVIDAMITTANSAYAPPPEQTLVVTESPPAERVETVVPAPSPDYVWISGEWTWSNSRWVWLPGHWSQRPRAGAVWVKGTWVHTRGGWRQYPGHWR